MVLRVRTPSLGSGGGAAAYTLTASTGSFTVTPKTANLIAGRKLTAAVGTFALTGVAAILKAGRTLTASTGSYTLTGVAASLVAGRKVTASTGTFTLTGVAATLTKSGGVRTLTASTGAFVISGQSATLAKRILTGTAWDPATKGATIALSAANYTATMGASPASDQIVRSVVTKAASSGLYYWEVNVDANVNTFNLQVGLCATSASANTYLGSSAASVGYGANGNVTINGSTVVTATAWTTGRLKFAYDTSTGKLWVGTVGNANWNGASTATQNPATGLGGVTFNPTGPYCIAASLQAQNDAVSIKTNAADWTGTAPSGFTPWGSLGYLLTGAVGSFALTGQTAILARSRIFTAAAGSYAITGQAATLTYGTPFKLLPAASGGFVVTGKTANFLYGRRMVAANGNFIITGQTASFRSNSWTPVSTPGGTWTPVTPPTTTWS